MVVDRVPAPIVLRVIQADLPERHVADREVEAVGSQASHPVCERAVDDPRVRVQLLGDRRGRAVDLHADHLNASGRQADEHAGAATGLDRAAGRGAERRSDVPHRLRDRGVGVVRVQGRAARLGQPFLTDQLNQLSPFVLPVRPVLVKQLRARAPARPPAEHRKLLRRGGAVLLAQLLKQPDHREVRLGASPGPGRRQPVFRGRRPNGRYSSAGSSQATDRHSARNGVSTSSGSGIIASRSRSLSALNRAVDSRATFSM